MACTSMLRSDRSFIKKRIQKPQKPQQMPKSSARLHASYVSTLVFLFCFFPLGYALYTLHFTLCTPHFTLYTLHFTLYTLHSTLHTPHFTLSSSHFTRHGVQKNNFQASIRNYLRDKKNHFSCAGAVFWPFQTIFKSCGL